MGLGISLVGINEEILRNEIGGGELEAMFFRFVKELRVSHAQYVCFGTPWLPQPVLIGTAPQDFVETYLKRAQQGDVSPLVERTRSEEISVMWSDITDMTPQEEETMDELRRRFGRNGISIRLAPKPYAVGISISSDEPDEEWKARSSEILWNGLLFGQKVHEIVLSINKASEPKVWLSENQIACLAAIASGMDVKTTADMCKLKEKSVLRHLDAAQKKLDAHNHTHAVAKAILLGLIPA